VKRRVTVHEPIFAACAATDWVAVCDDTDAQAYGTTPEEAIENLYEQEGWNDDEG
jgi:predicted RNase H-like HicB family nuclease